MIDTISYVELESIIKNQWNRCYLLPTDKEYIIKPVEYIMTFVKATDSRDIIPKGNQMSCDDISIYAWGMTKKLRYYEGFNSKDDSYNYSLPLGLCFGDLFNGIPGKHYQLITYAEEGLFLIEPQKETYWKPSRTDRVWMGII